MRLTLDTHAALLSHLPDLERVGGRKHGAARQRFLSRLFSISYGRQRQHRSDASKDSFSEEYLVKGLRVSRNGDVCAATLRPFYEFEEGRRGWSRDRGLTKAYRIRPELLDALHEVYQESTPLPVVVEDEAGNIIPMPENGSPLESLWLPSVIPLCSTAVDRAITTVNQWITDSECPWLPLDPNKSLKTTLEGALRLLQMSKKWIVSGGGMPNLYCLQDSGRLGPVGLHLITLPSRVRHLLLAESGLFEYDLASCHWRIFSGLAAHLGFSSAYVDDYTDDREGWMEHWSKLTGHQNTSDLKAVATSWFTGGNLSTSTLTTGGRLLGTKAMKLLSGDVRTRKLYEEIKQGMKLVVAQAAQVAADGTTVYLNALGAAPSSNSYNTVCSHLLSGLEQWVVREMTTRTTGLAAIIYDGWISERVPDVKALEEHIRHHSEQELGFTLDMRLTAKDYSVPFEAPRLAPGDF